MISGKYPRRKYGRSISRCVTDSKASMFSSPDLCASLIWSILLFSPHFFSLPFFAHARQRLPMFFSSLASGHTIPAYYTTPFPSLNRADRGGSENFLAGKKSSHSNARWKFGSEFFCTKLRCNEQLGCTR